MPSGGMKLKDRDQEKEKSTRSEAIRLRLAPLRRQARRDNSDVLGSYTGTPKDGGEPVQDADDL